MREWIAVMSLLPITVAVESFLVAVAGFACHEAFGDARRTRRRRLTAAGIGAATLVLAVVVGKFLVELMAAVGQGD